MTRGTFTRAVGMSIISMCAAGCATLAPGGGAGGATRSGTGGGFVDSGGFFTEGEGAGTIVVFEPEAEDEVSTESFFAARSIDPFSEDSAGPKFVKFGDIDGDGIPDLATAWNQSQVIQLQLQRRDADGNVTFQSIQIDGNAPLAIIAGLELADVDLDGQLDVVLLVKHNGALPICPGNGTDMKDAYVGEVVILFSPTGGDITVGGNWQQVRLVASQFGNNRVPDARPPDDGMMMEITEAEQQMFLSAIDDNYPGIPFGDDRPFDVPENGGMTALAVGDVNGDGLPDVVMTSNVPEPPCHNGRCEVELFPNPGAATSRDGNAWNQVILDVDAPFLKDVILEDVDMDGDLDVLATRFNAISQNVSWLENPADTGVIGPNWTRRAVGQVDGGADVMIVGDVDQDGFNDVVIRSNVGKVIQWFRHPSGTDELSVTDVSAGIPWSVYTLFELVDRVPIGLGIGDINFDGQPEVLMAAEGSVFWLDSSTAPTVFDEWSSNLIVDDAQLDTSLFAAAGPAFINDLLVIDIDCDGTNDVIATVDRRSLSGLSTDAVIWFRNILLPSDVGLDIPLVPGCP